MNRTLFAALVAISTLLHSLPAEACGCFAPPNPTVPVVQAGERILFAVKNGRVTAHVQVRYDGANASEFAWLLPMPSVPTLKLGSDELFGPLSRATQPSFVSVPDRQCGFGGTGGGTAFFGSGGGTASAGGSAPGGGSPVVVNDSVGPYDYAVLRADSKSEMIDWLRANRYFVPTSTEGALDPYVRPGAYFLALKLRPGASAGDLQPVVLDYDGDVASIPLTLTSVGATPNMPVVVWVLGEGRAIPRNYHHVVLNDAALDWPRFGANYTDVVTRAVSLAPGKHAFVTEYAGRSAILSGLIWSPRRFGSQTELASTTSPAAFISYLYTHGFASRGANDGFSFPSPLRSILTRFIPPPTGLSPDLFYRSYASFQGNAPPPNFQPVEMAREIWERVVVPAREAQALLDASPVLTRLFTTVSPQDMNEDPAFSFNRSLPDVVAAHRATMRVTCDASSPDGQGPSTLVTEQGWLVSYPGGSLRPASVSLASLPPALRIEILREEGPPEVVSDFSSAIDATAVSQSTPKRVAAVEPVAGPLRTGCSAVDSSVMVLLALALIVASRR